MDEGDERAMRMLARAAQEGQGPTLTSEAGKLLSELLRKARCHDARVTQGPAPRRYCAMCGWGRTWHTR